MSTTPPEYCRPAEPILRPDAGNTLRGRLLPAEGAVKLSGLQLTPKELAGIGRVVIVGCGTSMYAGHLGKYLFEEIAGVLAEVHQAAELRDRNPIIGPDTCVIAVSQSGETANTLAALREATRKGALVLGVCNVFGSTIAREAGRGVYLHPGPEIGVASTKAFTSQVAVLAMMAIELGRTRRLALGTGQELVEALCRLPDLAAEVIALEDAIADVASLLEPAASAFFIGRGYIYPAALEGALKLKEISHIHPEGYHAAELEHGPLALLDPWVPVVVAVLQSSGRRKTLANLQKCRARRAPVIAIATDGDDEVAEHADAVIRVPACHEFLSAVPVAIAQQLLAYHTARRLGCPIDQPRNLARAVTVE